MRAVLKDVRFWMGILGTALTFAFMLGGFYVATAMDAKNLVVIKNIEHAQIREKMKSDRDELAATMAELKSDLRELRQDVKELINRRVK